MMEDVRGAQEQFEEAVRTSPDYSLAQYSLGVLLQDKGRHAEAIDRFTAALRTGRAITRRVSGWRPACGEQAARKRRCLSTSRSSR